MPTAIHEVNAGLPFDRILLARAMGTTPASSGFTMKLNSSAKYGLTRGGYSDATITMTALGEAITAPRNGSEQLRALREAAVQPEVFMRFYQALDRRRIPDDQYAQNMLQRELGVHPSLSSECLAVIKGNGLYAGIVAERDGALFVELTATGTFEARSQQDAAPAVPESTADAGRIFVAHTGAADVVAYVAEVLDRFGIPYAVSELTDDAPMPIDEGVSREMHGCSAAVLVQGPGSDDGGRESSDPMVYQVGAASVLYGDRIVLLKQRRLEDTAGHVNLRTIDYDLGSLDQLGMALLAELHAAGIIGVDVVAPSLA